MQCNKCHNYEVSTERVEWAHKTAPVIQITDEESFKDYRRYVPHGRNTGMGSGCHRVMSSSAR